MTKVTTKITNKKSIAVKLNLPTKYSMSTKLMSVSPGKTLELDFDIWGKLSQINKLRLQKLIRTNQISIDTQVWTDDNKLITVSASGVNITQAPAAKDTAKVKNVEQSQAKTVTGKVDPTFRTTEDRNMIKGYKVVEGSEAINKLGFSTSGKEQTFDHSKALANNNDTKGFAKVADASVNSLVNKNPENVIKVDAPGLFKSNQENLIKQSKQSTIEADAEVVEESINITVSDSAYQAPTVLIDRMLSQGNIDELKDYLTQLYPEIKFTKKALKDCRSAQDIKLKFGLNDLL